MCILRSSYLRSYMQESILPHFSERDQRKFREIEGPRRSHSVAEGAPSEKEDSSPPPKIANFFEYIRHRVSQEVEMESKEKTQKLMETLIKALDDAAHRYIAVRVRHVRLADEIVEEREIYGEISEGKNKQFEATDRERKVAHDAYMDAIAILGRNLREQIARSHELEVKDVAPIDEEFADLFDRSNREAIARHATNYCWFKLAESLGIPYVERT